MQSEGEDQGSAFTFTFKLDSIEKPLDQLSKKGAK